MRTVITHASETRVLKKCVKQKLLITDRKVIRRIFGSTKERAGT